MAIRPLHDRVLVRRQEEETKTEGGIVLPSSAQEKPMQGQVVACGNGKVLSDGQVRPLDIKTGDLVFFGKFAGTEVKVNGETLLVMREEDIIGVVEA